VPISQEKFLSNPSNKNRFISTLMQKLENVNIIPKQAQNDAGVLIIETIIEEKYTKKTIMVGEDNIHLYYNTYQKLFPYLFR